MRQRLIDEVDRIRVRKEQKGEEVTAFWLEQLADLPSRGRRADPRDGAARSQRVRIGLALSRPARTTVARRIVAASGWDQHPEFHFKRERPHTNGTAP